MKLHLVSDLHLDHDPDGGEAFVASLPKRPDVDLLVIAGDCYSVARPHWRLIDALLELYPEILLVPGNHEYWGSDPDTVNARFMEEFRDEQRVHLALEPRGLVIKGQHFYAGTMWFRQPHPGQQPRFIDHDEVTTPASWFYEQNALFADRFGLRVGPDTIVVTHHLPSPESTPEQYAFSPSNHFFVSDMRAQIAAARPKMWLHGHTHSPCDYDLFATRVVCNPRGYPSEIRKRPEYRPIELAV